MRIVLDQLLCPLCGRKVALSIFDPEFFVNNILAVTVVGLGRARGFREVNRYSVLNDETITRPIAARCHKILRMIEGDGTQTDREATQKIIRAWADYAGGLETQIKALKAELTGNASTRSWVDAYTREKQRADRAEFELRSIRLRLSDLEGKVQRSINSSLPLEDGVGFLLER